MFSFRSISLVAIGALAAFSFAAPVENVATGLLGPLAGNAVSQTGTPAVSPLPNNLIARGEQGVADHFKVCHDKIAEIKIELIAALEAKVVVADVVKLLDLVVAALAALLVDVKLVLKGDACFYGGVVVTLQIIAGIVCELLQLVIAVVVLVLDLLVYGDISVVVGKIFGLLCEILTVVFALVAGLDLIVFGLVAVLVADIKSILACLKIDALLGLCGLLKIVL